MGRFLATILASAITAQVAFHAVRDFASAYPLWHGAVISAGLFGFVRLGEFAAKRRLPAWAAVPAEALSTGCIYWYVTVAMAGV